MVRYLGNIFIKILNIWFTKRCLKITHLKSLPHQSGYSELKSIFMENKGRPISCTQYVSWLLMTWQCKEPGHQWPWYWLLFLHIKVSTPEQLTYIFVVISYNCCIFYALFYHLLYLCRKRKSTRKRGVITIPQILVTVRVTQNHKTEIRTKRESTRTPLVTVIRMTTPSILLSKRKRNTIHHILMTPIRSRIGNTLTSTNINHTNDE